LIIGFVQTADHHAFLSAAGMSESPAAHLDAYMIDFASEAFSGIEKDQISVFKFI